MLTLGLLPVLFKPGEKKKVAQQVIFIVSVTCVHVNTRAHPVQTCFIMSEAEREV